MHMSITKFQVSPSLSNEELIRMFEQSVERYAQLSGLLFKHYFLAPDHWAGGVYLWESEAQAKAAFGDAFTAAILERFGSTPTVESMYCPISLDNIHKHTRFA